jgi:hypothetical protein
MGEIDIDIELGGTLPIAVVPTSTDATILQGAGRLAGWSLRDLSSSAPVAAHGRVVAPAALASIATTPALAAGTYSVAWTVGLDGAAAAADLNNFQILNGAAVVETSVNPGAAGEYPQPAIQMTVTAGSTVSVQAIGAGTAGVGYTADITLTPVAVDDAVVELQDGGNILGELSLGMIRTSTQWFGGGGPKIMGKCVLHVVSGTVTGVVYIIPSRGSQ